MKMGFLFRVLVTALVAVWGGASVTFADVPEGGQRLFVLTGQSNSLGAVKGSPASPELLKKYRSDARMWNGNMVRDTGVCFEKSPCWQAVEPQLPSYNGGLCMGPEYGFCHLLERRAPKVFRGKLGIIKASLDGGGNHYWQRGGKAYASMLSTISAAMKAQKGGRIVGLIYLQGESDAGDEITLAGKRFPELVNNLRKDAKAKKMTLCMVGEPADWHGRDKQAGGTTTVRQLETMASGNKNISWIRTRDLTKITQGDNMGVHYDGKSQITIGARYAYAVLRRMHLPLPGRVRSDCREIPLDSPSAWWSSEKASADELAVWDVAAANTEERLDGEWSARGIRVEDPFRDVVTIRGRGCLGIGSAGIVLQDADLHLSGVTLRLRSPQTWHIPAGRTLTLEDTPVTGEGAGEVSLEGEGILVLSGASGGLNFRSRGNVTVQREK